MTREVAQSKPWVAQLRGLKQQVRCVPCLERVKLPGVTLPLKSGAENWLFLTSEFAAKSVNWKHVTSCHVAALPAAARVVREKLKRVRVTVAGGALELANSLCHQLGRGDRLTPSKVKKDEKPHVVYATSLLGTQEKTHRQAVARLRACATVSTAIVYQTRQPKRLKTILRAVSLVKIHALFFSPSAVRHFEMAFPVSGEVTMSRALCVGASTVTAWNDVRRQDWPLGMAFKNAIDLERYIKKECT